MIFPIIKIVSHRINWTEEKSEMNSILGKIKNYISGLVAVIILCVASVTVNAEGTTTIHLSDSSLQTGETLVVTVKGTQEGRITVRYNAQVLSYESCNVSNVATQGNEVTFTAESGEIHFLAYASGNSSIIVSSDVMKGSSTKVSVAGETIGTEETTDTTVVDTTQEETGEQPLMVIPNIFEINGEKYVVSERFTKNEIPTGFAKTEVMVDGKPYQELSNGNLLLLYLKPENNTAGKGEFYIYQNNQQTVVPLTRIGEEDHYVIPITPTEPLSSDWKQASVTIEEQTIPAYVTEDSQEFYYIYGCNQEGALGWYQYDLTENTIQRLNETTVVEAVETELPVDEKVQNQKDYGFLRYVVAILVFVLVVVIVLAINLKLKLIEKEEEILEIQDSHREIGVTSVTEELAKEAEISEEKPEKKSILSMLHRKEEEETNSEEITSEEINSEEIEDNLDKTEDSLEESIRRNEKGEDSLEEGEEASVIVDEIAKKPVENKKEEKNQKKYSKKKDLEIFDLNDL